MKIAEGCRGFLVERIQKAANAAWLSHSTPGSSGIDDLETDGVFGPRTRHSIGGILGVSFVDSDGWLRLMEAAGILYPTPPSKFEICLQATAALEGHGFDKASGNYDGAGITWGIIGFNLKSGSLQEVLSRVSREAIDGCSAPSVVRDWIGELGSFRRDRAAGLPTQLGLYESKAFRALGRRADVQAVQVAVAEEMYWTPAVTQARAVGLSYRLLDLGLLFDVHVQNGPLRQSDIAAVRAASDREQGRWTIVNAVAVRANERWRADVLRRKTLFVVGRGYVHGRYYDLRRWGF